jgi:predicted nicotinamide N-methyase
MENDRDTTNHTSDSSSIPHTETQDDFVAWSEKNAVFGQQLQPDEDQVEERPQVEDTHDDDYKHIVFEYEELEGSPITLRTPKKGVNGSSGLAVWICSQILAGYLIDNPHHVQNESVLELGSGLGLCSIVAHKLKAQQVLATDGDVHVLQNLHHNTLQNAASPQQASESPTIHARQLVWGHQLDQFRANHTSDQLPSTILAADIFYTPKTVKPIWNTVQKLLAKDGKFLLAFCTHELPITHVLEEARERGFTWKCPDIGRSTSEDDLSSQTSVTSSFDDPVPCENQFGYHLFRFERREVHCQ